MKFVNISLSLFFLTSFVTFGENDSHILRFDTPNGWTSFEPFNNEAVPDKEEYAIEQRICLHNNFGTLFTVDYWIRQKSFSSLFSWVNKYSNFFGLLNSQHIDEKNLNCLIFFKESKDNNPGNLSIIWTDSKYIFKLSYVISDSYYSIRDFEKVLLSLKSERNNTIFNTIPEFFSSLSTSPSLETLRDQQCCGYTDPNFNYFLCYSCGNCVWWGLYKRPDLYGICTGSGYEWYGQAQAALLPTGNVPQVGAISCDSDPNHVTYVEEVSGNSFRSSEMWYEYGCLDVCCQVCTWIWRVAGDVDGFIYGPSLDACGCSSCGCSDCCVED